MIARYRWPWYWLVILAAVAVAGTIAIGVSSRSRLHAIDENFAVAQTVRLERIEQRIDDYLAKAKQLVGMDARLSQQSLGDERTVRWYTAQLFAARVDPKVYGVGSFYAPYRFDPQIRLVNVYDHVALPGLKTTKYSTVHGPRYEVVFKAYGRGEDDYTRQSFYRSAVAAHGRTAYVGPYTDHGVRYISVVCAFYSGGELAGVASVDAVLAQFDAMLGKSAVAGDVAWISDTRGVAVLSTAPIPNDPSRYRAAMIPLHYSQAHVHLTSDLAAVAGAKRETMTAALVGIAALWALALLTGIALVQRWRSHQDRQRLEDEVAFAKRVESELRKAAFTDDLTGLGNRAAFMDALAALLREPARNTHAVFLIDLDHFNIVNESLGHPAGDELLRVVASRLAMTFGGDSIVSRLGGDEFVVLASCTVGMIDELAATIARAIVEPVVLYGRSIYPQASTGVALLDATYREPDEVLRDADIAMYAAKERGRARHAVFDREMRDEIARNAELELHLRRAIDRGEITPHYQPIVDLLTRRTVSFEALARWNRGDEELAAASFVPFAESRGFIHEIDATMLRATLGHAKAIFALFPEATIALNVSATELTAPHYAEQLTRLLAAHGTAPERIRLEITETTMMTRADEARKTLDALARAGIAVVLDDFGTGYSSLAYLQRLSISGLKIDRSFVEHIDADERAREIVRSIVALAHALGLSTIAEGVERAAQVHELALLGVKYGQGFFFSRALSVSALADLRIPDEGAATAKRGE